MRIQSAKTSHPGEREPNQDRVAIVAEKDCVLLAVLAGMGGHADGETYLPEALEGRRYYEPKQAGYEQHIRERLANWRKRDEAA